MNLLSCEKNMNFGGPEVNGYSLYICVLSISYDETLTPTMMLLGDGVFGRRLGHEIKTDSEELPHPFCHGRTQSSVSQEAGFHQIQNPSAPCSWISASRTQEINFCCL